MLKKFHHLMLIEDSPWPLLVSLSVNSMFLSLVIFMKFSSKTAILNIFWNLMLLSFISFLWWKDYDNEHNSLGMESFNLEMMSKSGMVLFITSEFMLFVSLFWTYMKFFLSPSMELGMTWPPVGILMFDWKYTPMLNTIILVTSSITLTLSIMFYMKGLMKKSSNFMKSTILLGVMFSFLQYTEYKNSFFTISDSVFGSIFYLLTGLHGFHVIIGSLYLCYCYKKMKINFVSTSSSVNMELSSWYWHFVDLIWLYVFYTLYFMITM